MENITPIETTKTDLNQKAEAAAYRLNLSLTPQAKDELESLKKLAQKSSLVEVIRAALAVYKIVVEHQQSGGRVVLRSSGTDDETLRLV